MNNEPVFWMSEFGQFIGKVQDEICHIPLYTHPVNPKYDPETGEPLIDGYPLFSGLPHPVKELTDEEIEEIGKQYLSAHAQFIGAGECHYEGEIEFAKAILRKAQEK